MHRLSFFTYASFVHAPMMSQNLVDHNYKTTLGLVMVVLSYFSHCWKTILWKCLQLYNLPSPNYTLQCRLYVHGQEENEARYLKEKCQGG
jgi:hypothetical protein